MVIANFLGLNQQKTDNLSAGYAAEGYGFDVAFGDLKTVPGYDYPVFDSFKTPRGRLFCDTRPLMLARLTRRFQTGAGETPEAVIRSWCDYLLVIIDGVLYARTVQKNVDSVIMIAPDPWVALSPTPVGDHADTHEDERVFATDGYYARHPDWVAYEINYAPPETLTAAICEAVHAGATPYAAFDKADYAYYDVVSADGVSASYVNAAGDTVLLTVGESVVREKFDRAPADAIFIATESGLYCVYTQLYWDAPPKFAKVEVKPNGAEREICFRALAVHGERLWGAGVVTDPDKLIYSAPHDPFNWEQNDAEPADGAGDVQQPNFDGDEFLALRSFGGQLLAIKRNRIWRLLGTTPEDFSWREQYGGGAIAEDTIAVHGARAYMLADGQLMVYDGAETRPFHAGTVQDALKNYGIRARGFMWGDKYCLASNDGGDRMLIYDAQSNVFTELRGEFYEPFCFDYTNYYGNEFVRGETQKTVVFGGFDWTSTASGLARVFATREYPGGRASAGTQEMLWISPWQDAGEKNAVKSAFEVYLTLDADAELQIGVRTEKKLKARVAAFRAGIPKRVRLSNAGRRFRLEISNVGEDAGAIIQRVPLTISGGVQIQAEVDYD